MLQLSIAGVLMDFPNGIPKRPINRNFETFWSEQPAHDIQVQIRSVQPDALLNEMGEQPPGLFQMVFDGTRLHALKRTEGGVPTWSLNALNGMTEYQVSYNPVVFDLYYHSPEDLLCKEPGLLALVLSLHARGGLVFHGSASILDGDGILCVGRSGIGKSTISRILHNQGAAVLCDERPIVRLMPSLRPEDHGEVMPVVYGTPWPNIGGLAFNDKAPLKRIYFLEHGPENIIKPLSAQEASRRLVQVANILWEHPALLDPCLKTVEALLANVPAAVLSFRPDEAVVDVIRRDLAAERIIS